MQRAVEELNVDCPAPYDPFIFWSLPAYENDPIVRTLARLIAKHEHPPVDPILAAAREAVARRSHESLVGAIRAGNHDASGNVQIAKAAITLYLEREASK